VYRIGCTKLSLNATRVERSSGNLLRVPVYSPIAQISVKRLFRVCICLISVIDKHGLKSAFVSYLLANDPKYPGITANNHHARYDEPSDEQGCFGRTAPFVDGYRTRAQFRIVFEFTLNKMLTARSIIQTAAV